MLVIITLLPVVVYSLEILYSLGSPEAMCIIRDPLEALCFLRDSLEVMCILRDPLEVLCFRQDSLEACFPFEIH